ncbi:MAG: hypothetical protein ABIR08_12135 [Sphingomonas sp.]
MLRGKVYLVESGTHASAGVVVCAGYLFDRQRDWHLARDWSEVLAIYGLSNAREADCCSGNGQYAGLSIADRDACSRALMELTHRRTLVGFSTAMEVAAFAGIAADFENPPDARTLVALANIALLGGIMEDDGISATLDYYFNAAGAMSTLRLLSRMSVYRNLTFRKHHGMASVGFRHKRASPPMQAADMLAYHHYHYETRRAETDARRADFDALVRPQDCVMRLAPAAVRTMLGLWQTALRDERLPSITLAPPSARAPTPPFSSAVGL